MGIGGAGKASDAGPGLNDPSQVGEKRRLHSLAGEYLFALLFSSLLNGAAGIVEDDSVWALLVDCETGRG